MEKVKFNVSVDFKVKNIDKILKYHNQIMNSIAIASDTFLRIKLHEEYKNNMEEFMNEISDKYTPIKDYIRANMYIYDLEDNFDNEKFKIFKDIDVMLKDKGIYKSNGITSPYNPNDMVETILPYEPSSAVKRMRDMLKKSPKNPNIRKMK